MVNLDLKYDKRDLYEVLGLKRGASKSQIKVAYRKLAKKFHPDRNDHTNAEEVFRDLNFAYETLSDETKRLNYDKYGYSGINGPSVQNIIQDIDDIFATSKLTDDDLDDLIPKRKKRKMKKSERNLVKDMGLSFDGGVDEPVEKRQSWWKRFRRREEHDDDLTQNPSVDQPSYEPANSKVFDGVTPSDQPSESPHESTYAFSSPSEQQICDPFASEIKKSTMEQSSLDDLSEFENEFVDNKSNESRNEPVGDESEQSNAYPFSAEQTVNEENNNESSAKSPTQEVSTNGENSQVNVHSCTNETATDEKNNVEYSSEKLTIENVLTSHENCPIASAAEENTLNNNEPDQIVNSDFAKENEHNAMGKNESIDSLAIGTMVEKENTTNLPADEQAPTDNINEELNNKGDEPACGLVSSEPTTEHEGNPKAAEQLSSCCSTEVSSQTTNELKIIESVPENVDLSLSQAAEISSQTRSETNQDHEVFKGLREEQTSETPPAAAKIQATISDRIDEITSADSLSDNDPVVLFQKTKEIVEQHLKSQELCNLTKFKKSGSSRDVVNDKTNTIVSNSNFFSNEEPPLIGFASSEEYFQQTFNPFFEDQTHNKISNNIANQKANVVIDIRVPQLVMYVGDTKILNYSRKVRCQSCQKSKTANGFLCAICGGSGLVNENVDLSVQLPISSQNFVSRRFLGFGNADPRSDFVGDLIVNFHAEQPSEFFSADELGNLHASVHVDGLKVNLERFIKISTLSGMIKISLNEISTAEEIAIDGYGLKEHYSEALKRNLPIGQLIVDLVFEFCNYNLNKTTRVQDLLKLKNPRVEKFEKEVEQELKTVLEFKNKSHA